MDRLVAPVVLAGAMDMSPTLLLVILLVAAFMWFAHAAVGLEWLLSVVLVFRDTDPRHSRRAWLGLLPPATPHLLVAAHALPGTYHRWLAGTLGTCLVAGFTYAYLNYGAGADLLPVAAIVPTVDAVGAVNVLALLGWYATKTVVAWHALGRPPRQLRWRWLLLPLGVFLAPALYVRLLRRPSPTTAPPAGSAPAPHTSPHLPGAVPSGHPGATPSGYPPATPWAIPPSPPVTPPPPRHPQDPKI